MRYDLQVAVIVNDMAEVNIDAELVRGNQSDNAVKPDQVVELTNGCICCSLRDDLLQVQHMVLLRHKAV